MATITINDQSFAGEIYNKISIEFDRDYITVKELLESRIKVEIQKQESSDYLYNHGLVRPSELEGKLNQKKRPEIDLEKQLYIAFEAFQKNAFFVLIDDEQAETLEQRFLIDEATNVSFIKLTPLVGG